MAEELIAELDAAEARLIQPKAESGQDLFNMEPQLASNYAAVYGYVTGPDNYSYGGPDRQPTAGTYQRFEDLEPRWSAAAEKLRTTLGRVELFNTTLREAGVHGVVTEAKD